MAVPGLGTCTPAVVARALGDASVTPQVPPGKGTGRDPPASCMSLLAPPSRITTDLMA